MRVIQKMLSLSLSTIVILAACDQGGKEGGTARIVHRVTYSPCGQLLVSTVSSSPHDPSYTFTGYENEAQISKLDAEARMYDPVLCSFTGIDPRDDPEGSTYRYAANNPMKFVDPDGKQPRFPFIPLSAFRRHAQVANSGQRHNAEQGQASHAQATGVSAQLGGKGTSGSNPSDSSVWTTVGGFLGATGGVLLAASSYVNNIAVGMQSVGIEKGAFPGWEVWLLRSDFTTYAQKVFHFWEDRSPSFTALDAVLRIKSSLPPLQTLVQDFGKTYGMRLGYRILVDARFVTADRFVTGLMSYKLGDAVSALWASSQSYFALSGGLAASGGMLGLVGGWVFTYPYMRNQATQSAQRIGEVGVQQAQSEDPYNIRFFNPSGPVP